MSSAVKWETKLLDELAERIDYGHTASADQAVVGPKFLRITDIQNGNVDWNSVPHCPATHDELDKYRLRDGDIVFARTGNTTGKSFLLKQPPKDSVFASYLIRVRPSRLVDPRFLAHFFDTPNYWNQIEKNTQGAGQPGVNATRLKTLEIPLPPLSEQQRIADILDKADAIRRKRQEMIDLSQDILRSAYLHCFGDPIANPQGWPMKELGELADMVTGFAFKSSEYVQEGVRICRGANVLPDQIDWSDVRYWRTNDSTVDEKLNLKNGDVVLAMDRPWISTGIKVAQMTESDLPAYLVQRVTRLRGSGHISNAFLYYTIRHPAFTAHCGGLKTETTVPHISSADIKSFRVPVAPRPIHEAFEALANSTQVGFRRLRQAANEATSLFNSLVQRAFKGEL